VDGPGGCFVARAAFAQNQDPAGLRLGGAGDLLAELPGSRSLADDTRLVRLAERVLRTRADERPRTLLTEKEELRPMRARAATAQHDGVALAQGRDRRLFPVHQHRAFPHVLDLDGVGRGADEELSAREEGAGEELGARPRARREGLTGALDAETRELLHRVVPAPEEDALEGGEKGDLAGAMGFFRRPGEDERPRRDLGGGGRGVVGVGGGRGEVRGAHESGA
jgi:hypothetical protein